MREYINQLNKHMGPQNDKEIMVESLENPVEETSDNESNEKDLVESFIQVDENKDEFEFIYTQIENAFTKNNDNKELLFPMPRKWIGPRLLAPWIFPIFIIRKTIEFIKSDNFISLHIGRIPGVNTSGNPKEYSQLSVHWTYQLQDNVFVEASYGQNIVRDFPAIGLDTKLSNIVLKAKYSFIAPMNSILLPYVGYQILQASSPGEGVYSTGMTQQDIDAETRLMSSLRKKAFIIGATVLKKLVPGWFTRLDLGTDFYSLGFGLEF